MLAVAIGCEVTGSLSLKAAQTNPWWFVLVVVGYVNAFWALSRVLRMGMPLGVAYGIWGAVGVLLTAIAGFLVFGEALTPLMLVGIGLIMVGVLAVELGSHRPVAETPR